MILGFKDQFVPYVLGGSKTHIIRAGGRWRAGMRADLFARPRQKDMRLLFRAPVARVDPIEILAVCPGSFGRQGGLRIAIGGAWLEDTERESFFWRDGFRDPGSAASEQALKYWTGIQPFIGQLIHWDYDERFTDVRETCFRLTRALAKRANLTPSAFAQRMNTCDPKALLRRDATASARLATEADADGSGSEVVE